MDGTDENFQLTLTLLNQNKDNDILVVTKELYLAILRYACVQLFDSYSTWGSEGMHVTGYQMISQYIIERMNMYILWDSSIYLRFCNRSSKNYEL